MEFNRFMQLVEQSKPHTKEVEWRRGKPGRPVLVSHSNEAEMRRQAIAWVRDNYPGDEARDFEILARVTTDDRLLSVLAGEVPVSSLGDNELAYTCIADTSGELIPESTIVLPDRLKKQMQIELYKRANANMNAGLLDAIDALVEIAGSALSDDKDRIKAATFIIERLQGKTPEVVQHQQEKPWEVVFSGIQAGSREESRRARGIEPPSGIIDGETEDQEDGNG